MWGEGGEISVEVGILSGAPTTWAEEGDSGPLVVIKGEGAIHGAGERWWEKTL